MKQCIFQLLLTHLVCPVGLTGQIKCQNISMSENISYSMCLYNLPYQKTVNSNLKFEQDLYCILICAKEIDKNISLSAFTGSLSVEDEFFSLIKRQAGFDLRDEKIASLSSGFEFSGNSVEIRSVLFISKRLAKEKYAKLKEKMKTTFSSVEGNYKIYVSLKKDRVVFFIHINQSYLGEDDAFRLLMVKNRCIENP